MSKQFSYVPVNKEIKLITFLLTKSWATILIAMQFKTREINKLWLLTHATLRWIRITKLIVQDIEFIRKTEIENYIEYYFYYTLFEGVNIPDWLRIVRLIVFFNKINYFIEFWWLVKKLNSSICCDWYEWQSFPLVFVNKKISACT